MPDEAETPERTEPLEVVLGRIIELHGFSAVRKALDAWQAEAARTGQPLPETVTVEEMKVFATGAARGSSQ